MRVKEQIIPSLEFCRVLREWGSQFLADSLVATKIEVGERDQPSKDECDRVTTLETVAVDSLI